MAYPFMRMPTLGEFIRQATELHGAVLHESKVTVEGPDGRKTKPKYLTREHKGESLHATLPDIPDDEGLLPSILRNLSDRLGIDIGLYPGLHFTEEGFDYDDPPKKLH